MPAMDILCARDGEKFVIEDSAKPEKVMEVLGKITSHYCGTGHKHYEIYLREESGNGANTCTPTK